MVSIILWTFELADDAEHDVSKLGAAKSLIDWLPTSKYTCTSIIKCMWVCLHRQVEAVHVKCHGPALVDIIGTIGTLTRQTTEHPARAAMKPFNLVSGARKF